MDLSPAARQLLARQDGVIARRQALASGVTEPGLRRLLRTRTWVALHPGVYVDHTGSPSWAQRAWAAVLHAWPAALHGESALRAFDGPAPHLRGVGDRTIQVAVDRRRCRPAPVDGVRIWQVSRFEETVLWNLGPPRRRYAEAVLDAASAARGDLDRVAVIARACGTRRTTADQLLATLAARTRASDRRRTEAVLRDVAQGTCSVLEHGYLTLVERPHGLPRPQRQHREVLLTGVVYRDAAYASAVVELDGRVHHDDVELRDDDLERDLDVAADGRATVRLGWGQVLGRPCATAVKVAAFLHHHGVEASASPCGRACAARLRRPA